MNLFSVPSFRFPIGDATSALGKWSRVATFGRKSKDGQDMVFDASTLGQMVANAARRGDKIAICQDHLSAYVGTTGQPAPALGFFTALAVVAGGRVVKSWNAAPEAGGLADGLYALLGEITPRGADPKDGLANYAFLSPMFSMAGTAEDGSSLGPLLYDVAATNTPFQSGTEIQFHAMTTGAARATGATKMDDTEMAARFGWEAGDDAETKLKKCMAKFAAEPDKDDEPADGKGNEDASKMAVQLAAVSASHAALMARLAAVEASEKARAEQLAAEQNAKIEQLADAAIAGGYPKDARAAFVAFAKSDFASAQALAATHASAKGGAPAHLFSRVTGSGGPIGAPADHGTARGMSSIAPKIHKDKAGNVAIEDDAEHAEKIRELAFSKDPEIIAKVDALLATPTDRANPAYRLVVARKLVDAENPQFAEAALKVKLGMFA